VGDALGDPHGFFRFGPEHDADFGPFEAEEGWRFRSVRGEGRALEDDDVRDAGYVVDEVVVVGDDGPNRREGGLDLKADVDFHFWFSLWGLSFGLFRMQSAARRENIMKDVRDPTLRIILGSYFTIVPTSIYQETNQILRGNTTSCR